MSKFNIAVARIEVVAREGKSSQVRVTFQIAREPLRFQVPVFVNMEDFDDTEMLQAARNELYRLLIELAAQTQDWELTAQELAQLSNLSSRPRA
jgi:hypothetical protein